MHKKENIICNLRILPTRDTIKGNKQTNMNSITTTTDRQHARIVTVLVCLLTIHAVTSQNNNSTTKCFESTDELRLAVTMYFSGDNNTNDFVKKKFGDPIGTWCVDKISDFSYIFCSYFYDSIGNYYNSGAKDFNENISQWNTSSATNMTSMFDSSLFNQDISHHGMYQT